MPSSVNGHSVNTPASRPPTAASSPWYLSENAMKRKSWSAPPEPFLRRRHSTGAPSTDDPIAAKPPSSPRETSIWIYIGIASIWWCSPRYL
jgi:hypothetical protein